MTARTGILSDEAGGTGGREGDGGAPRRTYRLRQPVRFINHVVPVLLAVWTLVLAALLVVVVDDLRTDPGSADLLAIPFFLGVITILGTTTWLWTRTAFEVRVHDDHVEVVDMLRRSHPVWPGERIDLREQLLVPQPGTTRLKTSDRTLYLGPFRDKYEMIEQLRRMARGSGS